jgi:hypothetical protein
MFQNCEVNLYQKIVICLGKVSSKLHVRRHALYVTKYHNNFHVCFLQLQIKYIEIKGNDLVTAIKYGTTKKLYF